jgi:hypothetical protein
MSTPQEYWDACLIRAWRKNENVLYAVIMFKSITGKDFYSYDPPLLRLPKEGFPWKIGAKAFVADFLSKISKRLWEQPPEKDVLLLKKLKDSKYNTELDALKNHELDNERRQLRRNRLKVGMSVLAVSNRNGDTDWNTVKGSRKTGRRK